MIKLMVVLLAGISGMVGFVVIVGLLHRYAPGVSVALMIALVCFISYIALNSRAHSYSDDGGE